MTFSENLNRICRLQGRTLTSVLKDMGISTSKVTLWNNGSLPKQEMLIRLATELNCSVMDFFQDDEEGGVPTRVALCEDEQEIIRLFRGLTNKERHKFMAQAYAYEDDMLRKKE